MLSPLVSPPPSPPPPPPSPPPTVTNDHLNGNGRPRMVFRKSDSSERQQHKPPVMRAQIGLTFSFLVITFSYILISNTSSSLANAAVLNDEQEHNVRATPNSNPNGSHRTVLNYLLFSGFDNNNNNKAGPIIVRDHDNTKLVELLKDSNHSHVSDSINLQLANNVWKRMRQNAAEFAQQRANDAKPTINRLLDQAKVSQTCRKSLNDIIDRIANLDQWAVQMYNAFGDFPASGFFEGSLTSMGSYHQCVNLEPNELIGEPRYCTYKFQPIVPKRPKFHNILAPIEGLANFTSKDDMFYQIAKKAHYFYYVKLRLATCMPSKCAMSDLELLGKQVALNTYLQYSGVSCLQKEAGFNPDGAQIFALTILISLASISLLGTLVQMFNLRSLIENRCGQATATATTTTTNLTDLNGNLGVSKKNGLLFQKNQQVALLHEHQQQQQALLSGSNNQHKLSQQQPTTVIIQTSNGSVNLSGAAATTKPTTKPGPTSPSPLWYWPITTGQLLYMIDVLIHFSIINNARKLFDTSTSRKGTGRTSSLEAACKGQASSDNINMADNNSQISDSASSSSSSSASSPNSMGGGGGGGGHPTSGGQTNDISCVHGLRFWTITWIVFGHTMQYTEWAGFARAYQVEQNIVSFFLQPLMNATFSVDTFFLISGLLTTYVTWSITRGQYRRFNKFAFLVSRYLRLTPQVLLVILLFIVFPMMGDGPYWRGLIQKESDNCKRNWWVNALYLQAFIKQDHICNLVTWWLSIEMLYHFVSIIVIIALLNSTRKGVYTALTIGGSLTAVSCYLHYANHYPPNMLPTLLQRYEIWDSIVLKYFWTPYPHAPAYFVGLLLGFVLYSRSVRKLSKTQVRFGWTSFAIIYLAILFGTYSWNNNAPYGRLISTVYYNTSQIFWSLATAWCILACALGHGGWLNDFLSSPVFVPLGRATYMTYLSHMLVVMSYPAKMNLLIEPSYVVFLYIFISNLFLSYVLGIVLTLVYESPILHLQKLIVTSMALKFNDETPKSNDDNNNNNTNNNNINEKLSEAEKVVRVSLYNHQQVSTMDN